MSYLHSYGIFSDPTFIRRNTLLNFSYSNFPAGEIQLNPILVYSDHLRATYHDLTLTNDNQTRVDAISLTISTITYHSERLSELDWFYCERIIIHFSNLSKPIQSHTAYLLNRL